LPLLSAVLDANVLVPVSVTDTFLRSAEHRRYLPRWTDAILDEVVRTVARLHPEHPADAARRRVERMKVAFPEAAVTNWSDFATEMKNDPKDRHVLAAAVASGTKIIVTGNVSDFPESACDPPGIRIMTADAFLCEIWSTAPDLARNVIAEQASDLRGLNVESVLKILSIHVPDFVNLVRSVDSAP
jgi:predicted nucleic acid-binding protein